MGSEVDREGTEEIGGATDCHVCELVSLPVRQTTTKQQPELDASAAERAGRPSLEFSKWRYSADDGDRLLSEHGQDRGRL